MKKLTLIIVLLFSLSVLTTSRKIKKNSHHALHAKHITNTLDDITDEPASNEEPPAQLDDEACFNDENCHRTVSVIDSEGCTNTKECNDEGICEVYKACPALSGSPDSSEGVDDKTCLEDPSCNRNVDFCYFEGCCASKRCYGGDCSVALPLCANMHDKPELNDEECFNDGDCYRNVTICYFEGCCSYKSCSEGYCAIAMSMCIAPEEEITATPEEPKQGDEACFYDADCHRTVSVIDSEGCTRTKECDEEGNCEVYMACPSTSSSDSQGSSEDVDDKTCLEDSNCQRNVNFCYFEGCCASKECYGGECSVLMPLCATVHDKPELNDDDCFWDNDCYRNITSCDYSGRCCGEKICTEGYCSVFTPICEAVEVYMPEEVPITTEECLLDPECKVDVTYCWSENCCGAKKCDENGKCAVIIPECRNHPEECAVKQDPQATGEEVDDKTCFEDPNCHRSVTHCYYEDCCAFKECSPSGECSVLMPLCATVHDKPELNDEECFNDGDCYRNVTLCYFKGCCSYKTCSGGYCAIAMPMCIAPEEEITATPEEPKQGDEDCFYDDNCHRTVSVVDSEGCTRTKECDEEGNCEVYMACPSTSTSDSQGSSEDVDDKTCLEDSNCQRNVNFCYFEGCCASKECYGGECSVMMPLCATVHDKPELNDDDCFWDNDCYRNITSCDSSGGCCGEKVCTEGYCSVAIPICVQPELEIYLPEVFEMSDEQCLLDPECKVDVTYCWSENCCGGKKCDENGKCEVIIPECRNHPEECAVESPRDAPKEMIQLNKVSDESAPILAHDNQEKRSGLLKKRKANKGKDI